MVTAGECSRANGALERSDAGVPSVVPRQLVRPRELPLALGPVAAEWFLACVRSYVGLEVRGLAVELAAPVVWAVV